MRQGEGGEVQAALHLGGCKYASAEEKTPYRGKLHLLHALNALPFSRQPMGLPNDKP